MKKIIISLLSIILLLTLLSFPASALQGNARLSDDLEALQIEGETFLSFDHSDIDYSSELLENVYMTYSDSQLEKIDNTILYQNEQGNIISAEIYFTNGSVLHTAYLREDCFEEYYELKEGKSDNYIIHFVWPDGNIVETKASELTGTPYTLDSDELAESEYFYITVKNNDGSLTLNNGCLIAVDGDYFYLNFKAEGIQYSSFDFYMYDSLNVIELNNEKLIEKLDKAMDKYYSGSVGALNNDDFGKTVSTVSLCIVFIIVPLAILIMCIIFLIRSKGVYKKMFLALCILSGGELIVFAIITTLIKTLG